MIDLHTHTTASDGRCSPTELVARAAGAGISVLGVTDHDTVSGCAEAAHACTASGVSFVPGIEITAIHDGTDVHVLGYYIDQHAQGLLAFLAVSRRSRIDRVRRIIDRLADLGIRLDAEAILRPALDDGTRAAGRPWIARALVAAGHATSVSEAFDRWLSRGRPAFVPRTGPAPADVFTHIHEAGGLASLAHPALIGRDDWLEGFAAAGLDALEVFHPDHDPESTARYMEVATALGLAVSGGSDFHGENHGGALGSISLSKEHFARLTARVTISPWLKP